MSDCQLIFQRYCKYPFFFSIYFLGISLNINLCFTSAMEQIDTSSGNLVVKEKLRIGMLYL